MEKKELFELLKFTSNDAKHDDVKGWHLVFNRSGGEFTACGIAFDEYEKSNTKNVKSGGVTCMGCIEAIKFFKSFKLTNAKKIRA